MAKLVLGVLIACGALAIAALPVIYGIFGLQPKGWKIEWEAWATFAAGVLAVGAALVVGWKQAEIQSRQVDILKNQISSEERLRRAEINVSLITSRIQIINSLSKISQAIHLDKEQFYKKNYDTISLLVEAELIFTSYDFDKMK
jgi:hypothetical protein